MKKISHYLIVLLVLCILLAGCTQSQGSVSESSIKEGPLGVKMDPASGMVVNDTGDVVFLRDCPITKKEFVLPTVFDKSTKINAVGSHAFCDNDILEHLTVPDGYIYICMDSFVNFQKLQTVDIGKDVCLIEELCFTKCPSLAEFRVSPENQHYYASEGCVLKKEDDTLVLSNGIVPACTKIIGPSVFADNAQIDNLVLPVGITEIAPLAFNHSSLSTITLPTSLISLGRSAFQECNSLKELYIPNNVTEVGEKLFSMCDGITVYCEAESKPDGWSDDWLAESENVTVVWGYTPEE